MKKRIVSAALVPVLLFTGLIQTSCFGYFPLVRKVYEFNSSIGDSSTLMGRFVNNIVFMAFMIIPVYGVASFIDGILNLIEFWTGSNPLAMQEGEIEQQMVHYQGKDYLLTATRNQFKIEELQNGEVANEVLLQYCEEDRSWSAIQDGESHFLTAFKGFEDGMAKFDVLTAEGMKTIAVDPRQI